ncbi:helix-turn-helix domain-containing protein [Streptomyces goshikiensis]|uniref:helix-turn-helix domain-containing protein n=1 Tax=Streptomyces TaxID=1883 RepID=UPI000C270108|nr:helix-turn-helix domain-containing protein [Streptomyces sp. CB02120-2]PJN17422.1 transcriptional regulator [Streptomyces sp. CB02120-2]
MSLQQPEFGARLRELRVKLGLSQQQLAGEGLSAGYLSRLESGARPPTARTIEYLSERLQVSPDTFKGTVVDPIAQAVTVASSTEDQSRAVHLLETALAMELDRDDAAVRWQALRLLAEHQRQQGARDQERDNLVRLVRLSDRFDVPEARAYSRLHLARCERALGQMEKAHEMAQEALAITTEHDLPPGDRAGALMVLISTEVLVGDLAEAQKHAAELEEIADRGGEVLHAEALWTAAHVHLRNSDHAGAAERLDRALASLDSRTNPLLWLRLRLAAASLSLQMSPRRLDAAERCLAEAAPAVDLIGTPLHRQEYTLLKAQLNFQRDDLGEARRLLDSLDEQTLLLAYQDRLAWDVLRSQLRILGSDRAQGIEGLRRLAEEAEGRSNVDLSKEIWRALAETLARVQ